MADDQLADALPVSIPAVDHPGIDLDDPWQGVEVCFAEGWTDGLPVVPPTVPLVERMLAGGPWRADEVLLHEPVRDRSVTALYSSPNVRGGA